MQNNLNEDRWGIIYVPRPGFRHSSKRWDATLAYLDEKGVNYDVVRSRGVSEVNRLTRMLIENGFRMIVIVAGDAALNEAVNGLMTFDESVIQQVTLGNIPNGFSNNFASFWGFNEDDYQSTVDNLIRRRIRKIDLGLCYYQNDQSQSVLRYFINSVNIGLGASIIGITEQAQRLMGVKFLAQLFSSFRLIFERKSYKVNAIINYETFEGNVMGLCIGNCLGYGQTPNAVPYNGMVDVSVVQVPSDWKQIFLGLYLLLSGKFLGYHKVLPFRSREVNIQKAEHARISVDGRLLKVGNCPLHVLVKQEYLNFIIPSRP